MSWIIIFILLFLYAAIICLYITYKINNIAIPEGENPSDWLSIKQNVDYLLSQNLSNQSVFASLNSRLIALEVQVENTDIVVLRNDLDNVISNAEVANAEFQNFKSDNSAVITEIRGEITNVGYRIDENTNNINLQRLRIDDSFAATQDITNRLSTVEDELQFRFGDLEDMNSSNVEYVQVLDNKVLLIENRLAIIEGI